MKSESYLGKKVLVLGLGVSGRSAAYFLIQQGASVWGVDRNLALLEQNSEIIALKQSGLVTQSEEQAQVTNFDFLVVSPGIPPIHPLYVAAQQAGIPLFGEIELGCRSTRNPVIGITGTNGKTTVTLLVTHVLNYCGKQARAVGNVGVPFTKELLFVHPNDILVLELSSYQLETLYQRVLDIGVILNITPDHLDRYATMQNYAQVKLQMERCLKKNASLYIEEQTYKKYGYLLKEHVKTYGYSSDCFISMQGSDFYVQGIKDLALPDPYRGKMNHNTENLMAAYALCREMGVSPTDFKEALGTFKKPAHRVEFILEHQGISYYNDSKGTNVDAVIRAVQSLTGSIILIAGGIDKGGMYTPWLEAFANKVKYICVIGQAAAKIEMQLSHQIPVKIFQNLDQAVKHATELAQSGDNVLLSPGCSSLDMFRDYAHRGEEFKRIVRQL
jgi:UDP-N-acetylmuramoylalanine--D-glutamate ligase